jgi:hypothetical protein
MLLVRIAVAVGLGALLPGCFILELHRPRIDGVVVDTQQQLRPGVAISSCTYTGGYPSPQPRPTLWFDTQTDRKGRFHIPSRREWNFWLPGEEGLYAVTYTVACSADGRVAITVADRRASRVRTTLTLASLDDVEAQLRPEIRARCAAAKAHPAK